MSRKDYEERPEEPYTPEDSITQELEEEASRYSKKARYRAIEGLGAEAASFAFWTDILGDSYYEAVNGLGFAAGAAEEMGYMIRHPEILLAPALTVGGLLLLGDATLNYYRSRKSGRKLYDRRDMQRRTCILTERRDETSLESGEVERDLEEVEDDLEDLETDLDELEEDLEEEA